MRARLRGQGQKRGLGPGPVAGVRPHLARERHVPRGQHGDVAALDRGAGAVPRPLGRVSDHRRARRGGHGHHPRRGGGRAAAPLRRRDDGPARGPARPGRARGVLRGRLRGAGKRRPRRAVSPPERGRARGEGRGGGGGRGRRRGRRARRGAQGRRRVDADRRGGRGAAGVGEGPAGRLIRRRRRRARPRPGVPRGPQGGRAGRVAAGAVRALGKRGEEDGEVPAELRQVHRRLHLLLLVRRAPDPGRGGVARGRAAPLRGGAQGRRGPRGRGVSERRVGDRRLLEPRDRPGRRELPAGGVGRRGRGSQGADVPRGQAAPEAGTARPLGRRAGDGRLLPNGRAGLRLDQAEASANGGDAPPGAERHRLGRARDARRGARREGGPDERRSAHQAGRLVRLLGDRRDLRRQLRGALREVRHRRRRRAHGQRAALGPDRRLRAGLLPGLALRLRGRHLVQHEPHVQQFVERVEAPGVRRAGLLDLLLDRRVRRVFALRHLGRHHERGLGLRGRVRHRGGRGHRRGLRPRRRREVQPRHRAQADGARGAPPRVAVRLDFPHADRRHGGRRSQGSPVHQVQAPKAGQGRLGRVRRRVTRAGRRRRGRAGRLGGVRAARGRVVRGRVAVHVRRLLPLLRGRVRGRQARALLPRVHALRHARLALVRRRRADPRRALHRAGRPAWHYLLQQHQQGVVSRARRHTHLPHVEALPGHRPAALRQAEPSRPVARADAAAGRGGGRPRTRRGDGA
mmetsp:Transcript_6090/g.18267  ORF Transcript_6090/g.18267 Transcript_6090/m.18267 type:complete len:744 (-) Transcript_6090:450-2681(-)